VSRKAATGTSWVDDNDPDDPGYGVTNDHLSIRCRRHPDVHEWLELLTRLVRRAETLVELSRLFLQPQRVTNKRALASKFLLCCKAIDADFRDVSSLDSDLLITVLKRRKSKRSRLGGKCGMDAAIHVGRWLVHLFDRIGNNESPPRFRWSLGPTYSEVSWKRLGLRRRILAESIDRCLGPVDLDEIDSALRSDIAWLCARQPAARRVRRVSPPVVQGSTKASLRSYEEERQALLTRGDPRWVKAVLDKEGNLKERSCQILQVIPDKAEITIPKVVARLKRHEIPLTDDMVGHPVDGMKKLGLLRDQRSLKRTPLGMLFVEKCPDRDSSLES